MRLFISLCFGVILLLEVLPVPLAMAMQSDPFTSEQAGVHPLVQKWQSVKDLSELNEDNLTDRPWQTDTSAQIRKLGLHTDFLEVGKRLQEKTHIVQDAINNALKGPNQNRLANQTEQQVIFNALFAEAEFLRSLDVAALKANFDYDKQKDEAHKIDRLLKVFAVRFMYNKTGVKQEIAAENLLKAHADQVFNILESAYQGYQEYLKYFAGITVKSAVPLIVPESAPEFIHLTQHAWFQVGNRCSPDWNEIKAHIKTALADQKVALTMVLKTKLSTAQTEKDLEVFWRKLDNAHRRHILGIFDKYYQERQDKLIKQAAAEKAARAQGAARSKISNKVKNTHLLTQEERAARRQKVSHFEKVLHLKQDSIMDFYTDNEIPAGAMLPLIFPHIFACPGNPHTLPDNLSHPVYRMKTQCDAWSQELKRYQKSDASNLINGLTPQQQYTLVSLFAHENLQPSTIESLKLELEKPSTPHHLSSLTKNRPLKPGTKPPTRKTRRSSTQDMTSPLVGYA